MAGFLWGYSSYGLLVYIVLRMEKAEHRGELEFTLEQSCWRLWCQVISLDQNWIQFLLLLFKGA